MSHVLASTELRAFASFLREGHLTAVVKESLHQLRELDVPLMRLFAHLSEDELVALSTESTAKFLSDLADGTALDAAAEDLHRWEADEMPGIPKDSIEPEDLVLTYVAQKRSVLAFLPEYTTDVGKTLAIVKELDDHFMHVQQGAFKFFTRLRAEAAARTAEMAVEREMAIANAAEMQAANEELTAQSEEMQALNEELTSQSEELQSQQEELASLYEQLQQHSQRVEAEVSARTAELTAQHILLDGVLNNIPGAVGYCDADMVLRKVNGQYAAQLGKTPDEIVNKHAREVFPEVYDQIEAGLRRVVDTGEPWREYGTLAGVGPDGQERFQDFAVVPVYGDNREVTGFLSLSIDATARVRLEREVSEQARLVAQQKGLLERIIDRAPAGIAYLDRDLVVRWMNPEIVKLFQRPAEHFIDREFLHSASSEGRAQFEPMLRKVITRGEAVDLRAIPYAMMAPDGTKHVSYWDASYVPVFGDENTVEGLLVFTLEVSANLEKERLQQEQIERLQQLDHMKDDFLGSLSYQLSTPIHTILGFASVLEEGAAGSLSPQQTPYVKRILATSAVQLALVNDLLDLSRMSGGKFELYRSNVDLADLTERALERLGPLSEQQSQRIIRYLPTGLPKVQGDEQRLDQVLINLLHGAVKLTPPGGMIRVQVSADENDIRFEVQDSGFTLSPDETARVFERFTQLRGTWLGLSITKGIVAAHGGKMGADSVSDQGNVFWFSLPLGH